MTSLPLQQSILTVAAPTARRYPFAALFISILCLSVVLGARAQDAADFPSELEAAYHRGDHAALVAKNRLQVKPAVTALITESLAAELTGDGATAVAKHEAASAIASTFEETFGEKSLSEAATYLDEWSLAEKRAKLRADSLLARGRELRSGDEAHATYKEALATYHRIGDRIGVAETLGGLGVVHWFAGRADSTLAYFKRGLEARLAVDDRQLVGNGLNDIGSALLYFKQDYAEALKSYLRAAEIREEIGDREALARTYNVIATSYSELGRLDSAFTYFQQAADLNRIGNQQGWLASNLNNAASILIEMGRSSEALSMLDESFEVAKAVGDTAKMSGALNWTGAAFRRVGDFDAAIEAYQKAVRLADEIDDQSGIAYARLNIGVLLEYADRSRQAIGQYEKALPLFESIDDREGRLLAALGLSNAHLSLNEYDEAENSARLALEVSRIANYPSYETRSLITLGNVQVLSGHESEAIENFSDALHRARSLESPDLIWAALLGHGDYYDRVGEYERAVDYYEQGLEVAESVRGELYSEEEKAGFLAQKRFAYEHIVHMLGKLHGEEPGAGHHEKAFEIAERAKARSFLDMLAESVSDIESGVDPKLRERESNLIAEIGQTTKRIQTAAEADEKDEREALHDHLAELEEDYRSLRREIRMTNPAYAALQYPEPTTLAEVQTDLLGADAVLLEYALGDSSSALWAISGEDRSFYVLPARDELQEQVEILRFALEHPDESQAEIFAKAARELYRTLVEPAEEMLREGQHVIIVPDDILYYVPFEALLSEPIDEGSVDFGRLPYLIRTHSLSYGQSASVLMQLQARDDEPQSRHEDLLAFGDPVFDEHEDEVLLAQADEEIQTRGGLERLPHSGAEVSAIASLFPAERVSAYLRAEAVEERLKEDGALTGYKYIHFATHGIINERRPDFSSIVLSLDDDPAQDGFLQAAEIFNLKMNPDLVVLSACETGLGKMVRGEGIVGLTRAFMYAGAPSIVVSLWRVADESTAELMKAFYERLAARGEHKADALRGAKLDMVSEPQFAHPFHWAPFVMVGGWN